MIHINLSATMQCAEKGCGKTQAAKLFLNTMGCFSFAAEEEGWQVLASAERVAGPYVCKCPEHRQMVTQATVRPTADGGLKFRRKDS